MPEELNVPEGGTRSRGWIIGFIKSRKFYLLGILFLILIIISGFLIYKEYFRKVSDLVKNEEQLKVLDSTMVVTLSDSVQVKSGDADWSDARADQILLVGDIIKTGSGDSNATIKFHGDDYIVLDKESEISIIESSDNSVLIDQRYGSTYNQVNEREGFTYTVTKDDAKATALGTEFLVDVSTDGQMVVSAFEHTVRFEHKFGSTDITELNQYIYNFDSGNYETKIINKPEEINGKYLALINQARERVVAKKALTLQAETETSANAEASENGTEGATSGLNSADTSSGSNTASTNSNGSQGGATTNTATSSSSVSPASSSSSSQTIFGRFSTASVESIVSSLQLYHDDPAGDFMTPPGGAPPTGTYDYDPIDLDKLYLGVRNGRLYIKFSMVGTFPSSRQTIGDNSIESIGWNLIIDKDDNQNNGCFGAETMMGMGISYHESGQIWYNA